MADVGPKSARPLSPHLQVYRMLFTMVMSGAHRITGLALYIGTLLLAWWLMAAAVGPDYFEFVNGIAGSIIGRLALLGFTWSLLHHLIGGLRYFVWDCGYGFSKEAREGMARWTLILSIALTIVVWIIGYAVR